MRLRTPIWEDCAPCVLCDRATHGTVEVSTPNLLHVRHLSLCWTCECESYDVAQAYANLLYEEDNDRVRFGDTPMAHGFADEVIIMFVECTK
jgi:hypothetical protein